MQRNQLFFLCPVCSHWGLQELEFIRKTTSLQFFVNAGEIEIKRTYQGESDDDFVYRCSNCHRFDAYTENEFLPYLVTDAEFARQSPYK